MSKKFAVLMVLAVLASAVLSACGGTTQSGVPCDQMVTTCAYEVVTGKHTEAQPAIEPVKRTDLTRDFTGAYCLIDEAISVQSVVDHTFASVCPSTRAQEKGDHVVVVLNGFASWSK